MTSRTDNMRADQGRAARRAARLDDPRFEKIRTPAIRRGLVVAMVILLAVEAAALSLLERVPVFAAVVLAVVLMGFVFCLGTLKAATRGVEELASPQLGERQLQLQGIAYRRAYQIGTGLLTAEVLAVGAWTLLVGTAPTGLVTAALIMPFTVALALPTLVSAWTRQL